MSTKENQISYIKNHLIPQIVEKLKNEILISSNLEVSDSLDGFMSSLYKIQLQTKDASVSE